MRKWLKINKSAGKDFPKWILALLIVLTGCHTPIGVERARGKATVKIYHEPYKTVWRGAVLSLKSNNIDPMKEDSLAGIITGQTQATMHNWGNYVQIWVTSVSENETKVEVVSREKMNSFPSNYSFEKPIINSIDVYLETLHDAGK